MTDPQRRTINTPDGPYVVYHRDTAGLTEAHQHPDGPWYFQPAYYDGGNVYSKGYPSPEAASEAAWEWAHRQWDQHTFEERAWTAAMARADRKAGPTQEEDNLCRVEPPTFTTAADARTFVLNSGILDWGWGSAASWEAFAAWLWQHHSDEDLPRDHKAWWNECLRRYLVSVGEDPADYSLSTMQQLAPTPSPERQR